MPCMVEKRIPNAPILTITSLIGSTVRSMIGLYNLANVVTKWG